MPLIRLFGYAVAKSFSKLFGLATITFFGRVPSKDPAGHRDLPGRHHAAGQRLSRDAHGNRSEERGARQVLREMGLGYAYTAVVGGLVILLVLVVPVVKASYILRMFDLKHVAVMINGEYDQAVEQIRDALARNGMETEVTEPHWTIRRIFTSLAWMEAHIFRREVANKMLILRGQTPEEEEITDLCTTLRGLSLETEEWNAIRRQLYTLETETLRAKLAVARGEDPQDASTAEDDKDQASASSSGSSAVSSLRSGSSSPRA